jgi:hypothetical protein
MFMTPRNCRWLSAFSELPTRASDLTAALVEQRIEIPDVRRIAGLSAFSEA